MRPSYLAVTSAPAAINNRTIFTPGPLVKLETYQSLIKGRSERERERGEGEEAAFNDQSVGPRNAGLSDPMESER